LGQATVYCEKCGVRLTVADFEEGRAVRYRNMTFCDECRAGLSGVVESVADDEGKSPKAVGESTLRQAIEIESDRPRSSSQESGEERPVDVREGGRSDGEGGTGTGGAEDFSEQSPDPDRASRSYAARGPTRGSHGNQMIYIGGGVILLSLIVVFIVVMLFG